MSHQIVFLENKKICKSSWHDVSRASVHAADTEQRDLAKDGALAKSDDHFTAVYATENLNLTCKEF